MVQGIKVEIEEEEWFNAPKEIRDRIKFILINEYGYDVSNFDVEDSD